MKRKLIALAVSCFIGCLLVFGQGITFRNVTFVGVLITNSSGGGGEPPPVTGSNFAWPLRVSSNGRYLTDTNGQPFILFGSSGWTMMMNCSSNEVTNYLTIRSNQGFNAQTFMLAMHTISDDPPRNYYGNAPFTDTNDFSTGQVEAYWSFVDYCIEKCRVHGQVAIIYPLYIKGWENSQAQFTVAECSNYGRWVATRYVDKPNIIWGIGGDVNPDATWSNLMNGLAGGITNIDTNHVMTAYCGQSQSAYPWYPQPWLTLDNIYIYDMTSLEIATTAEWRRSPAKPVIYMETRFEGEGATPIQLRQSTWGAFALGLKGTYYSHGNMWGFVDGWEADGGAIYAPGVTNQTYAFDYLRSFNVSILEADTERLFGTNNWFYDSTNGLRIGLANDRSYIFAYEATNGVAKINPFWLNYQSNYAVWIQPTNGVRTTNSWVLSEGNTNVTYTSPGAAEDWALHIIGVGNTVNTNNPGTSISLVSTGAIGAASGTMIPGWPSGMQANDIAICAAFAADQTPMTMAFSQWTHTISNGIGGGAGYGVAPSTNAQINVWWHRYDGVTTPTLTVTGVTAATKICNIAGFRGCVTTGSPILTNGIVYGMSGNTNMVHPGVTVPGTTGGLQLLIGGSADDNNRYSLDGYTVIFNRGNNSNAVQTTTGAPDASLHMFTKPVTNGLTETVVIRQYGASPYTDPYACLQLILKPAEP